MPTGPPKKQGRFRLQLYPKMPKNSSQVSWERMRTTGTAMDDQAKLSGSSSRMKRPVFRVSCRARRVKTFRLGGSRRVRLQRSMGGLRRWVVAVSGWAGVAVRSKAKVGLAFLREALKLLVTGLHAPSSEMSMAGYHIGASYHLAMDEVPVLVHRRLEMHHKLRQKSRSGCESPAGQRKAMSARCAKAWSQIGTERIITFPGSTLARRHAPHKGLATIAESALESEVRV